MRNEIIGGVVVGAAMTALLLPLAFAAALGGENV